MLERRRSGRLGFTLIDMLVVITIIGLLAALVGPRILGRMSEAKSATAKAQLHITSWK